MLSLYGPTRDTLSKVYSVPKRNEKDAPRILCWLLSKPATAFPLISQDRELAWPEGSPIPVGTLWTYVDGDMHEEKFMQKLSFEIIN